MDTETVNFQIKHLEEYGFVLLKNIFESSQLMLIRSLVNEIIDYADMGLVDPFTKYSLRHRSDQGVLYDLFQRHPEFRALATNSTILDCVEGVLGKNFYLYDNSLIYKPRGKSNAVPWHQDFISRPNEPLKLIAWMPLDDVTAENGALEFIPGSHKLGHQAWHRVQGETHHDRINLDILEDHKENIVTAEMNAGDVLIFNMLLIHGSPEVNSENPRRAFRCSYQSMEQTVFTPRQSPLVMRGGSPKFLSEKFSELYIPEIPTIRRRILKKIANLVIALSK